MSRSKGTGTLLGGTIQVSKELLYVEEGVVTDNAIALGAYQRQESFSPLPPQGHQCPQARVTHRKPGRFINFDAVLVCKYKAEAAMEVSLWGSNPCYLER